MLATVGNQLYSSEDPAQIFSEDHAFQMEDEGASRYLILDLPYVEEKDIDVIKEGEVLYLTIKNEMRCFTLPDQISRRELSGWNYENGTLKIIFDYV